MKYLNLKSLQQNHSRKGISERRSRNIRNFSKIYNQGFTLVEILLSFVIISAFATLIMGYYIHNSRQVDGQMFANRSYELSQASTRYIMAHYQQYNHELSQNIGYITVPVSTLIKEKFINGGFPLKNNANQAACLVIFKSGGSNADLSSFIYFRPLANSKIIESTTLYAAVRQVGDVIEMYRDGKIFLPNGSNQASITSIAPYLTSPVYVPDGGNAADYTCLGSNQIANGSIIINTGLMQQVVNALPQDTALGQDSDPFRPAGTSANKNTMNGTLTMGNTDEKGNTYQSQLVFQNNLNCQAGQKDAAGNLCNAQQLSLSALNGNNAIVTGFNQAADPDTKTYLSSLGNSTGYVGGVQLNAVQPQTQMNIGDACTAGEVGKMAQQNATSGIAGLIQSQVQCMVSPICRTGPQCYLPINSVTITINFTHQKQVIGYTAPQGFYIVASSYYYPTPSDNTLGTVNDLSADACSSPECVSGMTITQNHPPYASCWVNKDSGCGWSPDYCSSNGWYDHWGYHNQPALYTAILDSNYEAYSNQIDSNGNVLLPGTLLTLPTGEGNILTLSNWNYAADTTTPQTVSQIMYGTNKGLPITVKTKYRYYNSNEKEGGSQQDHTCRDSWGHKGVARNPYYIQNVIITNSLMSS